MTMMLRRALPVIACLSASLVFASLSPAFAQDEEDETAGMTFERSLIHQLLTGLGAVGPRGNKGIDYRERSPLVLPPSNQLPTPQVGGPARAANWPKDPDEAERQAAIAAAKLPPKSAEENARPLLPSELAKGRNARRREAEAASQQPGQRDPTKPLLPSDLGYRGGLFGNILTPQKEETAKFTGEPPRETLTAPPAGYQTPSPSYAYGIGVPKAKPQIDPSRPLPPGQF